MLGVREDKTERKKKDKNPKRMRKQQTTVKCSKCKIEGHNAATCKQNEVGENASTDDVPHSTSAPITRARRNQDHDESSRNDVPLKRSMSNEILIALPRFAQVEEDINVEEVVILI